MIILVIFTVKIIAGTAQTSNVGFSEGNQYRYQLTVAPNTDGYSIGRVNNSVYLLGEGSHYFNLTFVSGVTSDSADITIHYNNSIYPSKTTAQFDYFSHEYFLYTTWDLYIDQLATRFDDQTSDGYKTGYHLYYKLTETEFIVKEIWDSNSKPILTGSTTKHMEREVRYDRQTGIQTFYTEQSYTESDYRTFTYDYTLKRTDVVHTEIRVENMIEIANSSSDLGPSPTDFVFVFPLAILTTVVVIRYAFKRYD